MTFKEEKTLGNLKGIYKIENLNNGFVYIGQTRERFYRRFWHHDCTLKSGKNSNEGLQQDWNTYGAMAFEFSVLEVVDDLNMLDIREIYWIDHYKNLGCCYNLLGGGGGRLGYKMKDSTKALIGAKNREHMTGKKHSEETKQSMSKTRTGQDYVWKSKITISEDQARRIKELLISGCSLRDAATATGVDYKVVNRIVSCNAYKYVLVDGWDEFLASRQTYSRLTAEDAKTIRRLSLEGYQIQEIAEMYNKSKSTIRGILNYKTFKTSKCDNPVPKASNARRGATTIERVGGTAAE